MDNSDNQETQNNIDKISSESSRLITKIDTEEAMIAEILRTVKKIENYLENKCCSCSRRNDW